MTILPSDDLHKFLCVKDRLAGVKKQQWGGGGAAALANDSADAMFYSSRANTDPKTRRSIPSSE